MNTLSQQARSEVRRECRHFTRPVWRAAIVAICLILLWGLVWRIVHVTAKSQGAQHRVLSTR